MTALEKAARAACEADGGDWDMPGYAEKMRQAIRAEYRVQARAVLMAVLDFAENDPSDPLHGDDRFLPFVRAILNEGAK